MGQDDTKTLGTALVVQLDQLKNFFDIIYMVKSCESIYRIFCWLKIIKKKLKFKNKVTSPFSDPLNANALSCIPSDQLSTERY